MSPAQGTYRESIPQFGEDTGLVAILTEPDGRRREPVLLINAGVIHRVGPHRLHVRLARALAARGFPALRLDLSGIGDSRPLGEGMRFRDSAVADIRTVLDGQEVRDRVATAILFGICSGADNALAAAQADPRVAGIVLVDPHAYPTRRARLRHVGRRIANGGLWQHLRTRLARKAATMANADVSPGGSARHPPPREDMRRQLQALTGRGVRILSVHTAAQGLRNNHASQLFECFPELRGKVDTLYFPRANHTFTELAEQSALIEAVVEWCDRRFPAA